MARIVGPNDPNLPPDAAKAILALHFDESSVARLNELAEKNRTGTLGAEERNELESYLRTGNFLNLLHAKARVSLQKQNGSR